MKNLKNDVRKVLCGSIVMNPFFEVCLDEVISLMLNSAVNGINFTDHYTHEELINLSVREFVSNATILLKSSSSDQSFVFRGIQLRDYSKGRDDLLSQLSLLNAQG